MEFVVSIPAPVSQPVTFHASGSPGTATGGVDFTSSYGAFAIWPGETATTIPVQILSDDLDEDNETIRMTLGGSISGGILGDFRAAGTIIDDDGPTPPASKTVSVDSISVVEGKPATFTIRLSQPATERTVVRFRTANGTAMKKHDYKPVSGSVSFKKGETTKTVTVKTRRDKAADSGEFFVLELFMPPAGWTLAAPGVATLT